jgi:hypothetical protein
MYFEPNRPRQRAPRTSFDGVTPAVLRCLDGRQVPGKLQVVSLTGGLLCLSEPLDRGCRVKLMFLTPGGAVLGAAVMLSPISWGLQPFKFVELHDDDEGRLQAAIQSSLEENRRAQGHVERHRAW